MARPIAQASLPVFSFMGDDTETVTSRTKLDTSDCTIDGAIQKCADYRGVQIASVNLNWLTLKYNQGLLYEVLGSASSDDFGKLLEAFTAKYGAHKAETRKWQSRGGASFDNAAAIWQFKGGKLELSALGTSVDALLFQFVSTANSPPSAPPTVDF